MGITTPARNRRSDSEAVVFQFFDILLGDGRPEAGPACTGIKFGVGAEESCVAADAAEEPFVVDFPVRAGERDLRVRLPSHCESGGAELFPPFRFTLNDL